MPKKLFDGTLIVTDNEPNDEDRLALGQPDTSGSTNIKWGYFKTLIAAAIDFVSSLISVTTAESVSATQTTQYGVNIENKELFDAILSELARLASASAAIEADPLPVTLSTIETTLDFATTSSSSDEEVLTLDPVVNTLNLISPGRWTFLTSLEIENTSSNTDHTVTLRTRRLSDDTILTTRIISITKKTTRTDFRAVLYDLVEANAPETLYISLEASSDTDLTLNKFETTLSIGGVSSSGISHATSNGYAYVSKNDAWEWTDQLFAVSLGSLVNTIAVSMDELRPTRINLSNTLSSLSINITAPVVSNTNYILRKKDVMINNDTGAAIEVTINADEFYNGLSSVYSFPVGVTMLNFTYAWGTKFAGLVEGVSTSQVYDLALAISDETTELTIDNDASLPIARTQTLVSLIAFVNTAPAGSSIIIDVQKNGTSIATLTIAIGTTYVETTTISDTSLSAFDVLTFDVTQVGATTEGNGLKIHAKTTL